MTDSFLLFFEISVSVSLMIVILFLFTPFLNKRYAAKWKYRIWIFLALRLIIPLGSTDVSAMASALLHTNHRDTLSSGISNMDNPPEHMMRQGRVVVEIPVQMTVPIELPVEVSSEKSIITLLDVVALVWLIGGLMFLTVHLISYAHYKRKVLKEGREIKDIYILRQAFELKRELQIKDTVRIMEYSDAGSPMMIGFIKPVLILPEEQYGSEELYFILKHEMVHLKRRDVYIKLLLVAANAVHWFNPLVWIMQKEASVDMELSCDERVTQGTDYAVRKAYTETLLSTLHRRCAKRTVLSTQFYGGKQIMKKRFKNILVRTGKKNGVAVLTCAVTLTVGLGTLVGCSVASGDTEGGSGQIGNGNAEGGSGQIGNGNAEDRSGQSAQAEDRDAAGNNVPGTDSAQAEKLVYIESFDGEKIFYDEIEWVQVPGERAAELGITEDDAPSGFSIYNEEAVSEELSLAGDCTCTLLDWTSNYTEMQVTLEELTDILAERKEMPVPYHITVRNNEIISITEQYVP